VSCAALLLLAAAVATLLLLYARAVIHKYTASRPEPITQTQATEEDAQALTTKWSEFADDLTAGRPVAPLTMSSTEVNVFLAMMPRLNKRVHVTISANRLRAEFSVPLDTVAGHSLPGLPKGRYANGVALLTVSLGQDHRPRFGLDSLTLNGKPLPDWAKSEFQRNPHVQDVLGVLSRGGLLSHLRSIEVRGDQLVFVPVNSM
jgi:hypothetical protein